MKELVTKREVIFAADGFRLRGVLHFPVKKPAPVIIGSHGLFSSGDSPKLMALAERCAGAGMAFFRFDHRGCGQSSGEFARITTLAGRREDVIQAVNIVRQMPEIGDKIGLFGSSFGGAVVLSAAGAVRPSAVVTLAAPIRFNAVEVEEAIRNAGDYELTQPDFYQDRLGFDISGGLSEIGGILIIHGEKDLVIPVAHAQEIYCAAAEPKRLIIQSNGDHRISHPVHQAEFISQTSLWFENLLRI